MKTVVILVLALMVTPIDARTRIEAHDEKGRRIPERDLVIKEDRRGVSRVYQTDAKGRILYERGYFKIIVKKRNE